MRVEQRLRQLINDRGMDASAAATTALNAATRDELVAFAYPPLRRYALQIEGRHRLSMMNRLQRSSPSTTGRAKYERQIIRIGKGEWRLLGDMTIEDHEARIAFYLQQQAGIDLQIARHKCFIDVIQGHSGAVRLKDVPDWDQKFRACMGMAEDEDIELVDYEEVVAGEDGSVDASAPVVD